MAASTSKTLWEPKILQASFNQSQVGSLSSPPKFICDKVESRSHFKEHSPPQPASHRAQPTSTMAKDKSISKEERKAAKKASKETLIDSGSIKKDKKDKKEKKDKKAKLAEVLSTQAPSSNVAANGEVVSEDEDVEMEKSTRPIGALVPFANPLADDKVAKKVFRGVKKGTLYLLLLRRSTNSSSCCTTNVEKRSERSCQSATKIRGGR